MSQNDADYLKKLKYPHFVENETRNRLLKIFFPVLKFVIDIYDILRDPLLIAHPLSSDC